MSSVPTDPHWVLRRHLVWSTQMWHMKKSRTRRSCKQAAIWDAVAGYVQEQLLLHKGLRIPSLGSFDAVPIRIQVGDETVTIQSPVFHLARNLAVVHNLMDDEAYLPGNKEVEPLKYSKVATVASVSRQKVEACIQGTMSLLSHCLGKGENIALVLKDVGVLLIEGMRVTMKYFNNFLEKMSGKKNLEIAGVKVPQLLDMVVSQAVPLASLTFSGRVIIFPEFELEFVHRPPPPPPPPRDPPKTLGKVPGEDKQKIEEVLPALGQGTAERFPELPSPAYSSLIHNKAQQLQALKAMEEKSSSRVSWLPGIPEGSSGKKQPVTAQPKGKSKLQSQASKPSQAQAAKPRRGRGEGQTTVPICGKLDRNSVLTAPSESLRAPPGTMRRGPYTVQSKLLSTSSEVQLPEELGYKVFIPQPPRPEAEQLLKSRPEMFWSVLREPQKTILGGYSFEPSLLVPPVYKESLSAQRKPLRVRSVVSRMEWPWLE
ncbi:uncharacterized protein [Numenius arquata]|uniref:uncharacterized protein n=1 Tax=Numenius arquata TaxID=31919 RepID=UPI003D30CD6A